ncbi:MAG: hypothetical protein MR598_00610 [Erysipelotrichaceae bacterium]|nr:hypothetical protein [Erysipelotrichaceae bacterium]
MKKIITTTLSILLALTIILEITYTSLSNSITENKIKESIKNNLLTGLIYDDNGNKTEIFNTIVRLTTLDEDTVIRLMENETADGIITDIVNSIYDYNLTGDESVKYTGDEIISIVEDNIDKVLSEINYPITKEEREETITYTKTHTDYILDTIYSTDIGDYTK